MAEATEFQTAQVIGNGTAGPLEGTKSHGDILGHAESMFQRAKNTRLQFEKQWYLNLAFYAGKQYVDWVGTYGSPSTRLVDPPSPKWRVRLVSNQVRRYVRKEHSKATKEDPTGFVLPSSGDESDIMAAKAGDQILEHLFREIEFTTLKRQAVFWACMTGNGFFKDFYSKSKKEEDTLSDMPKIEVVTPFHLFVPDVVEQNIEGQEVVFQVAAKSVDYVKRVYGVEVSGETRAAGGGFEEKFFQSLGITESNERDQVYVREAWFKPCSKYPDGAVVVWSPGKILHYQEIWPYSHGQYPYTKIDHIPTGKFYNESMVTDLIPLQKEYNKTRSQIIEAKNKMSKPQLTAQLGSIDANKVTSEPGLIIFYRPGFERPEPLPLQALPSYVIQELERSKADMDDISSQHEVSRGQAPPGVEAATAISYLQEQDDTVLSDLTSSIERAVEKVGRHLLHHVGQNWEIERQVQIVGLNQQLEAFEFSKASLQDNTAYHVEAGSATPRSSAGKQAFIMEAMDKGWIPVPTGLKYLSMAETGRIYEELQIDMRHAQRENLKMSQGAGLPQPEMGMGMMGQEPVPQDPAMLMQDPNFMGYPTNSFDNDLIHVDEHDNWRKRQEFEASDPLVKMLFEKHQLSHKRRIAVNLGMPLPPPETDVGMEIAYLDSILFKIKNGIPLAPVVGSGAESGQEEGAPPEGSNA